MAKWQIDARLLTSYDAFVVMLCGGWGWNVERAP
jgi:hypothetical protein